MRNAERVAAITYYLSNEATKEYGRTVKEIAESGGMSRTAVSEILKMPGFLKADFPLYPAGWYFDAQQAIIASKVYKNQVERGIRQQKAILNSGATRDYHKPVDLLNVLEAYDKACGQDVISNWLDQNVKQYLLAMDALVTNVNSFAAGETKLNPELLTDVKRLAGELVYNGETILRAVGKINEVDPEDIEWWTNFRRES
jgi:hypothetical protein